MSAFENDMKKYSVTVSNGVNTCHLRQMHVHAQSQCLAIKHMDVLAVNINY